VSVSIIIVNYNSSSLLGKCWDHLAAQTILPNQIFVVDNASTDGFEDITKFLSTATVIRLEKNIGFATANNLAVAQCSTDWVVLLNPDAFPDPEWLERLLAAASKYPACAMFGSRLVSWGNSHLLDGDGDQYHVTGLVWREGHGFEFTPEKEPWEIFSPCAAAAMYRTAALRQAGGFDDDFFCYLEDVDLGFRLRLLGHHCLQVPDAIVYHMGSATTGGQHSDFAVYHGHRNLVWTFFKNMPSFFLWLFLPLHMAGNLASVIWYSLKGQAGVILKAKKDALSGLMHMWRKRRRIQEKRVVSARKIFKVMDWSGNPRPKCRGSEKRKAVTNMVFPKTDFFKHGNIKGK
jgi:GT2 family glycosyltransferase